MKDLDSMDNWDGQDRREQHWHLKKEIPIATILTLVSTIVIATISIAQIKSDVYLVQHDLKVHEQLDDRRESLQARNDERVYMLLESIQSDLSEIKVSVAVNKVKSK